MSKGSAMVKGAVRKGEVLLAGLLRCGHCGRKLQHRSSDTVSRQNLKRTSSEPPRIRQMHQEPVRLGHRCIDSMGLSRQTVFILNAVIVVFPI